MHKANSPYLNILFSENGTGNLATTSDNQLRSVHFSRSLQDTSKNSLTNLYVPSLTNLDSETWQIAPPAYTQFIESRDKNISILKNSGGRYDYLRFVCKENSESSGSLQTITYRAYEDLFELIAKKQVSKNIIRMWNFIPRILEHQDDLVSDSERYRQFNSGRRLAWEDHSGLKDAKTGIFRTPAATGIGSLDGPLVIEALLTNDPVIDIQNPRQIDAFSYSQKYGTHPPMFSRATAQLGSLDTLLFISGTASIVGEDTLHKNDPVEQTHETFRNFTALISTENLNRNLPFECAPLKPSDLQGMRVHIKNSDHLALIKSAVQEYMGDTDVCYVNDDICRDGLLVEIESNGTILKRI